MRYYILTVKLLCWHTLICAAANWLQAAHQRPLDAEANQMLIFQQNHSKEEFVMISFC